MLTPNWTLLVAAAVFLVTLFILNRLLFRPLFAILAERDAQTTQVSARVQEILAQHQSLLEEHQTELVNERQAGYKMAESLRSEALKEGNKRISQARQEAERMLADAGKEIEADLVSIKEQLTREAEDTARILTDKMLGRR